MEQSPETPQEEPEFVESDNRELKPAGKVTYDKEGRKLVGSWYVDEEGFFLEPPSGTSREVWERQKELYRRNPFGKKEDLTA